jgi:hypothetical protein
MHACSVDRHGPKPTRFGQVRVVAANAAYGKPAQATASTSRENDAKWRRRRDGRDMVDSGGFETFACHYDVRSER